jgi:hypothetical protein
LEIRRGPGGRDYTCIENLDGKPFKIAVKRMKNRW